MPLGNWDESDWRQEKIRPVEAPIDSRPLLSLTRAACLDVKKARRDRANLAYSSSSLFRDSSGNSEFKLQNQRSFDELQVSPSGSFTKELSSTDLQDAAFHLKRSEHTLRKWNRRLKNASSSHSSFQITDSCQYLLPKIRRTTDLSSSASTDFGIDASSTISSEVSAAEWRPGSSNSFFGAADESSTAVVNALAGFDVNQQFDERGEWNKPQHINEALVYMASTNVPSIAAQDMLGKFSVDGSMQSQTTGFTKRYFAVCEVYGSALDCVKSVLRWMDEAVPPKIEKTDFATSLGQVVSTEFSHDSLSRDYDFHKKLQAETNMQDGDNDERTDVLPRAELSTLLKEVAVNLERIDWEELLQEFKRWIVSSESSDATVRRLLDETTEAQRETFSILSLSKFLVEETLSIVLLNAAKALGEFHNTALQRLAWVGQSAGALNTTTKTAADSKQQESKRKLVAEDEAEPQVVASQSQLSEAQQAILRSYEKQKRSHKRTSSELYSIKEEHVRKIQLNRSLYEHIIMTTLNDGSKQASNTIRSARKTQTHKSIKGNSDQDLDQLLKEAQEKQLVSDRKRQNIFVAFELTAQRFLQASKGRLQEIVTNSAERDELISAALKLLLRKERTASGNGDFGAPVRGVAAASNKAKNQDAEMNLLQTDRDKLWDQLNKQTVEVSLVDILINEPPNSKLLKLGRALTRNPTKSNDLTSGMPDDRPGVSSAAPDVLPSDSGVEVQASGDQTIRQDEETEESVSSGKQSRRRAMLFVQEPIVEVKSKEAPVKYLEGLAGLRDKKHQEVSLLTANQEALAARVARQHGNDAWDLRLDAQNCEFKLHPYVIVLDMVGTAVMELTGAVSLLNKPELQKSLQEISRQFQEVGENIVHNQQRQQNPPVKSKRQTSAFSDAETEIQSAKDAESRTSAQMELVKLAGRCKEWLDEATAVDLAVLSQQSSSIARGAKLSKLQTETDIAHRRAEETAKILLETEMECGNLVKEKVSITGLTEGYPKLLEAMDIRQKAEQELRTLKNKEHKLSLQAQLQAVGNKSLQAQNLQNQQHSETAQAQTIARQESSVSQDIELVEKAEALKPAAKETEADDASPQKPLATKPLQAPLRTTLANSRTQDPAKASVPASDEGNEPQMADPSQKTEATHVPIPHATMGSRNAISLETQTPAMTPSATENIQDRIQSDATTLIVNVLSAATGFSRKKSKDAAMREKRAREKTAKVLADNDKLKVLLKEAWLKNKVVSTRLERKKHELAKVADSVSKRHVERSTNTEVNTAEGWAKAIRNLERDYHLCLEDEHSWEERFHKWHEDVLDRYGETVLVELLVLNESEQTSRDLKSLEEALLECGDASGAGRDQSADNGPEYNSADPKRAEEERMLVTDEEDIIEPSSLSEGLSRTLRERQERRRDLLKSFNNHSGNNRKQTHEPTANESNQQDLDFLRQSSDELSNKASHSQQFSLGMSGVGVHPNKRMRSLAEEFHLAKSLSQVRGAQLRSMDESTLLSIGSVITTSAEEPVAKAGAVAEHVRDALEHNLSDKQADPLSSKVQVQMRNASDVFMFRINEPNGMVAPGARRRQQQRGKFTNDTVSKQGGQLFLSIGDAVLPDRKRKNQVRVSDKKKQTQKN